VAAPLFGAAIKHASKIRMIERGPNAMSKGDDDYEVNRNPGEAMDDSDEGETAVIPTSLIGDQRVKPGDVIRLKVVSSDENGITVAYDHPAEESGGSDAMAGEFEPKEEM
jgi:hypothetical protein